MRDLLTAVELAKLLKVPLSWVYDRTRKGSCDTLPFYKVGKYVRFSEEEVIEYLKNNCNSKDLSRL